ncbi:MAG: serine/threonine protein kinase [Clostridium sp.]
MEVKACMGCFVEWDRERDECPVCGWSPQKPLEEDKNGWHQGKIIAKRFLLGNCYLKKKDFVIWRTYDSLLDIRCYMITSVGGSLTQLLQIAWGFSQQRDKEGCPVVLSMFPVEQVYVLVFSMKENMDKKDFLSWIMLPKENPKQVIQKLEYLNEKQKPEHVLSEDTLLDERYRVIGCIGVGGFGITYLCEDLLLQRNVAVKEYFPSEWAEREADALEVKNSRYLNAFLYGKKSFLKEAKITAKFIHAQNIVTIYDVFSANDTVYLVMEYLQGDSVGRRMKKRQYEPYSERKAVEIILSVMKALCTIHENYVVHGDISPGNLICTKEGTVVLIDFGAAKYMTDKQPVLQAAFLKKNYAAPEQYRTAKEGIPKDEGAWTDIYAMGATFYYLLTGHVPTDALTRLSSKKNRINTT